MAKQDTHHVVPNQDGGWDVKRGCPLQKLNPSYFLYNL